jgi:hypothetical protein
MTESPNVRKRKALNVRCIPKDVLSLIKASSEDQRRLFLVEKGFSSLLDITLDALGSPTLIGWLYDHINPNDMTLNVGLERPSRSPKTLCALCLGFLVRVVRYHNLTGKRRW